MVFDRAHARSRSHGSTASGTIAAPGKRTQLDLISGGHAAAHGVQRKAHGTGHPEDAEDSELATASAANPSGVNMEALKEFLVKHEGYVDHVYRDSRGFPTAGIGHLLPRGKYRLGQKVSAKQINAWFKQDAAEAIRGAKQKIGDAYERLNEARKIVVIDMVFNLGSAGFGMFQATIRAIRAGAYAQAATQMLDSLWASQVGVRATENAAIMRSGRFGGGQSDDHDETPDDRGDAATLADVRAGRDVLKVGSKGPAVTKLQRMLRVTADGIFGNQTRQAVEKFQRAHNLTADGIVGPKTLDALEDRARSKRRDDRRDDGRDDGRDDRGDDRGKDRGEPTGGVRAPDEDELAAEDGERDEAPRRRRGKWSPAPPLDEIKSGAATLRKGDRGPAVKHVQRLLAVEVDGKFGPATRAAVIAFQREHEEDRRDGVVDAHTLKTLTKHPVGGVEGESRAGAAQRQRLLGIARSGSAGRRPDGYCYRHVCLFLVACNGYGKIKNPYEQIPTEYRLEAYQFAKFMDLRGPAKWGLDRLSISNPYDAPAGSIVVVAAGSPGTAHPTAGDIAVADGDGNFYNGGDMSYGGRAGWNASRGAKLLGCYIPL